MVYITIIIYHSIHNLPENEWDPMEWGVCVCVLAMQLASQQLCVCLSISTNVTNFIWFILTIEIYSLHWILKRNVYNWNVWATVLGSFAYELREDHEKCLIFRGTLPMVAIVDKN